MEYRIISIMGDVFIFDIDGCIMPNIFSIDKTALMRNSNKNRENVKNVSQLSLYPEFIEFYKNVCTKSLAVYFLTGRKQSEYGKITEKHLKTLKTYKKFNLKYYLENKTHYLKEYFKWKTDEINRIMDKWPQDYVRFHIFDDLGALFPFIFKEISPKTRKYYCELIQTQADWNYKVKMES